MWSGDKLENQQKSESLEAVERKKDWLIVNKHETNRCYLCMSHLFCFSSLTIDEKNMPSPHRNIYLYIGNPSTDWMGVQCTPDPEHTEYTEQL